MSKFNLTRTLIILAFTIILTTPAYAGGPGVTKAIDLFIAKLFPDAANYYWVINNAQTETKTEMIIDLNAIITRKSGSPSLENRYLLLILDGNILAAQHIPLASNVDCGKDQEV